MLLFLLPWMLGAGGSGEAIGELQFHCEEAAAHAAGCCPEVKVAALFCSYEPHEGCYDASCEPHPVLSGPEAACVRDTPCERLRSSGACGALRALEGKTSCDTRTGVPREPVCR